MNYLKKLKNKWGIKSNLQLLVIFFVFGLTGSVSMKLTSPTLSFFNIKEDFFINYLFGDFAYTFLKIVIIFPIYQILLLFFGLIFFQFNFFWKFEKKLLSKIGLNKIFKK